MLPHDAYWALLGFQADWRLARAGIVKFTMNLTVAEKAGWARAREMDPTYPEVPSANGSYGREAEVIRIGHLIPLRKNDWDRWWTLDRRSSPDRVADEVLAAARDHAIPWLRSRVTALAGGGRPSG